MIEFLLTIILIPIALWSIYLVCFMVWCFWAGLSELARDWIKGLALVGGLGLAALMVQS